MSFLDIVKAGFSILGRDLWEKKYKRYQGGAVEICQQIVKDRWNGTYFEGGETIFCNQFWIRDFSLYIKDIIGLGHIDKVRKNLDWALSVYESNGKIGTTILGGNTVFDFWHYSADSLPFLLYSIKESQNYHLVERHKHFLNVEIKKYFSKIFDPESNLTRKEVFSIPKDVIITSFALGSNLG